MKRYLHSCFLFAFLGIWLTVGGLAVAQTAQAPSTETVSAANETELKALIQTLGNDAERKKLISQLELLLAAKSQQQAKKKAARGISAQAVEFLSRRMESLSGKIVTGTRALLDLPNVYYWAADQFSNPVQRAKWIEIAWKVALAIVFGFVVEWFMRLLLAGPRSHLESRELDGFWIQASTLLARTILDIAPIAGFVAGSYAVLLITDPGTISRDVIVALIIANVVVRLVMAIARMILAPAVGSLRLLPMIDSDANYLFIWIRRFTDVTVYGMALIQVAEILGVPESGGEIFLKLLGLFVVLLTIVFILQNRNHVTKWLRGGRAGQQNNGNFRARLADIWHVPAILYVIAMFAVWALAIEDGFSKLLQSTLLTILVLFAARLIVLGLVRAARRVFALREEVKQRYPGLEARANRYQPILERTITIVIWFVAAFTVFEAWGIDSYDWLGTPFGQRATGSLVTIILLIIVTTVVWEMTSAIIERSLSSGTTVSARARTLLPLLRMALLVVLVTMVVMVSLSELGLNIGPLLAGAGVVGLAIGFGAQTLVKDIITGIFILIEDHISVGDVVKVDTHAGVVEKLTLRTIQLRDVAGTVHVLPFSAVTTLENMTKDFSRYVFNVGIAYREDTDHVVTVLRQLGDELMQDEAYKNLILEPLEIMGVDSFGDNAVVIKARITTVPIKQWAVGREFNRRMKKRFDELGIEIPFPHRTIYFGEDSAGNAPPARIATVNAETHIADRQEKQATAAKSFSRVETPTPDTGGADVPDSE